MHRWVCIPAVALFATLAHAAEQNTLESIASAREAGASLFAIELLDRHQPTLRNTPDVWMRWERERVQIYVERGDWSRILERRLDAPPGLDSDFLRWWDTRVAEARIALGEAARAREQLANLIWRGSPDDALARLPEWRQLIIRSYLAEDLSEDAYSAWLKYGLDNDPPPRSLQAQVLLAVGQNDQASALLEQPENREEQVWAAVAHYRLGHLTRRQLATQLEAIVATGGADDRVALSAWQSVLAATESSRDALLRVQVFEHLVAHPLAHTATGANGLADGLWQAYLVLARQVANDAGLLVGRYQDWLTLAEESRLADPVVARSIYAHVALEADDDVRQNAETALVESLLVRQGGVRVLEALYFSPTLVAEVGAVPVAVVTPLVEVALAIGDTERAARLARPLDQDSAPVSRVLRARTLLPSDTHEIAVARLSELLDVYPEPDATLAHEFRRAIDALPAGAEGQRYELLVRLARGTGDPAINREVMMSLGASSEALGDYYQAALHYLQVAVDAAEEGELEWRLESTARAAGALASGNASSAALELYGRALQWTTDPVRRRLIRNAMDRTPP